MIKISLKKDYSFEESFVDIKEKELAEKLILKPNEFGNKNKITINKDSYSFKELVQIKINIKEFGAVYLYYSSLEEKDRIELLNKIQGLGTLSTFEYKLVELFDLIKTSNTLFVVIEENADAVVNIKDYIYEGKIYLYIKHQLQRLGEIATSISEFTLDDVDNETVKEVPVPKQTKKEEPVVSPKKETVIDIADNTEVIQTKPAEKKDNKYILEFFKKGAFDIISCAVFSLIFPYLFLLSAASFTKGDTGLAVFCTIFSVGFLAIILYNNNLIISKKAHPLVINLILLGFTVLGSIIGTVVGLIFINIFIKVSISGVITLMSVLAVIVTLLINVGSYFLAKYVFPKIFKKKAKK